MYREFGALMNQGGAGGAVVRLGWEAIVGPGDRPWGIAEVEEIPAYKRCFRRQARALTSLAPNLKIEWSMGKCGDYSFSVLDTYPGDDVVDIWGVQYYDTWPRKSTQAIWGDYFARMRPEVGSWGLGT